MELNLIVPVEAGAMREKGDEEINGRLWRVTGPHDPGEIKNLKFHCISYVWGSGTEGAGSFFDCKRPISDQTRYALLAAINAADLLKREDFRPQIEKVEAFWIDALCIPQLEGDSRQATLERYVQDKTSVLYSLTDIPEHGIYLQLRSFRHHRSPGVDLEHYPNSSIRAITLPILSFGP
jgi:Heterokaryon incompatibility protein (HET)